MQTNEKKKKVSINCIENSHIRYIYNACTNLHELYPREVGLKVISMPIYKQINREHS